MTSEWMDQKKKQKNQPTTTAPVLNGHVTDKKGDL